MGNASSKGETSTSATTTTTVTAIKETEPLDTEPTTPTPLRGAESIPQPVQLQDISLTESDSSPLQEKSLPTFSSETATPASSPKMTAMAGLEEQLREMLQCKICFEDQEKQKLLPCQHTICLDCLNRLVVKDSKYKCPLCNREMFVPNGGFEALQESLITKQLAHLIAPRDDQQRKPPTPAVRSTPVSGAAGPAAPQSPPGQEDEIERKLNDNIRKGRDTLAQSQNKLRSYQSLLDDLEQTADRMKTSINNLMEQTIDKLMANASKKVSAIDDLTQKKREELLGIICKLSDTDSKTNKQIELLQRRVGSLRSTAIAPRESAIANDLQNTQTAISAHDDFLTALDSVSGSFRAGDSVRLRMDESMLNSEFLLSDLNHYSIGYIHQVDDDGDCAVIFAENARWTGNISQLEKSATKHTLATVGDRVRVKPTVTEPHFKWGMVKSTSIGILSELKNTGPKQGRQVEVDFPEDHDWSGLFHELEKVAVEPLKVGEKVWVAKDVSEPVRGWAGVTPSSEGILLSVNGNDVEVNFPECSKWKGLLSEVERVRPITVGDKVKVKRSVTEPKFAWGGVDHDDVGKVAKILNSSEHGQVAKIDFPNRLGLWQCLIDEIEIVSRHTGGEQSSRRRRRSSDLQCPTQ